MGLGARYAVLTALRFPTWEMGKTTCTTFGQESLKEAHASTQHRAPLTRNPDLRTRKSVDVTYSSAPSRVAYGGLLSPSLQIKTKCAQANSAVQRTHGAWGRDRMRPAPTGARS